MRQLLVALDGSCRAPDVFDAAVELAEPFGAAIYPFRAIFVPPEFPAAAAGSQGDRLPDHLLKEALADLARLARPRVDLDVRIPIIRVGQPWKAIVDAADELDVDLIVIGSHGYHGLDRVLGTTAARVVNHARRDVLVVHTRRQHPVPLSPHEVS